MATERDTVSLSFKVIKRDIDQSRRAIDELNTHLAASETVAASVAKSVSRADRSFEGLAQSVGDANEAIAKQNALLKGQADQLRGVTTAAQRAAAAQAARSRAEAFGRVSTGSMAVAQVAQLAGAGPAAGALRGIGDITGVLEQLPRLGEAFKTLTGAGAAAQTTTQGLAAGEAAVGVAAAGAAPGIGTMIATLGPLAIAAVAVALTFQETMRRINEGKAALERAAAAQHDYYEAIETGTVEGLQDEIEERELHLRALQREQEALTAQRDALRQQFGILTGLFAGPLNQRLQELEAQTQEDTFAIDALTRAQQDEAVIARSTAEAVERANEAQISALDRQAQINTEVMQLMRSGTSEQLRQRQEQIDLERRAIAGELRELRQMDQASQAVIQRTEELRQRYFELGEQQAALSRTTLSTTISAREAMEAVRQYDQQRTAIEQRRAEARNRLDEAVAAIGIEVAVREEKAIQQHAEKMADLQKDYQKDERKRVLDFQIQQLRDLRQYQRTIRDAAARLDALAVIQEQQNFHDQLQDQEDNFRIETQRREEEQRERLAQEREGHRRQLEEARRADQQRINDLRQRFAIEDQAARQELYQLQQKYSAQLSLLSQHLGYEVNLQRSGLAQIEADYVAWLNRMIGATRTVATQTATTTTRTSGGSAGGIVRAMQSGGEIGHTGTYLLHQGEEVIRPGIAAALRQAMSGSINQTALLGGTTGGGRSVSIGGVTLILNDVGAKSSGQIREEVMRGMIEVLQAYNEGAL